MYDKITRQGWKQLKKKKKHEVFLIIYMTDIRARTRVVAFI